ncbi:MAG TPA: hypothetical protein VMW24_24635 [Sedimentisphaerales bacterium]|nr:hypothetical protein [Sedimentisphaerales bacterium]
MATIREWLLEAGFAFKEGRIIWQPVSAEAYSPGWCGTNGIMDGQEVGWDHDILDHEFDSGFGAPECPRFIAEDDTTMYFPRQYDGATKLVCVRKDIAYYLNHEHPTPYPGG